MKQTIVFTAEENGLRNTYLAHVDCDIGQIYDFYTLHIAKENRTDYVCTFHGWHDMVQGINGIITIE